MNKKKVYRYLKKQSDKMGRQRLLRCYNNTRYLYRKPYVDIRHAISVAGHRLFISGSFIAPSGTLASLELRYGEGSWCDISTSLKWHKDDLLLKQYGMYKHRTQPRFMGLIELPDAPDQSKSEASLRFNLRSGRSIVKSLDLIDSQTAPLPAIEKLLGGIPLHHPEKRDWFDQVYGPTVSAIWASRIIPEKNASRVDYNAALKSKAPPVTLVIPIYGRYDFIEYQLSEFVNDPDMYRHEIIYVIDDPRLSDEIRASASVLERIYKIAFSIVYLPENRGFAGASNAGAEHATSSCLLMMNSDVMPLQRGWLNQLLKSVGDDISSVITGVRLLYQDHAIQHNGMRFFASPFVNDLWTNVHPAKGMPTDMLAASNQHVACEAVTGACLLISKDIYTQLGGFDESYILGDYEDSDLCMKARKQGFRIKLDEKTVLFHLERLSQSLVSQEIWKEQVTYYNCWLHTTRWHEDICELKHKGAA